MKYLLRFIHTQLVTTPHGCRSLVNIFFSCRLGTSRHAKHNTIGTAVPSTALANVVVSFVFLFPHLFSFFSFPNGNFEVDLVLPVLLEQFKSKRLEGEDKARGKFRFNSMMRVLQNNAHVVFILAGF